jgi:hypothetical protein
LVQAELDVRIVPIMPVARIANLICDNAKFDTRTIQHIRLSMFAVLKIKGVHGDWQRPVVYPFS